jgi:hypothetical protein
MAGSWRPLNSEVHGLVPTAKQSAPFFVARANAGPLASKDVLLQGLKPKEYETKYAGAKAPAS